MHTNEYDCLRKSQPSFTQTEFHFIVPSLPMHAHCLHWLISTGLLFHIGFCWPCIFASDEMVPMPGSKSAVVIHHAVGYYTHLSSPCSGLLAYSKYMYTAKSLHILPHSVIYIVPPFVLAVVTTHHTPSRLTPYLHKLAKLLIHSFKITAKNWWKSIIINLSG